MTLSKSQYIRGLQCHKSLWLYKNRPELRTAPDAAQESLFETGYQVGELAIDEKCDVKIMANEFKEYDLEELFDEESEDSINKHQNFSISFLQRKMKIGYNGTFMLLEKIAKR